jgi:hypothetical protein
MAQQGNGLRRQEVVTCAHCYTNNLLIIVAINETLYWPSTLVSSEDHAMGKTPLPFSFLIEQARRRR